MKGIKIIIRCLRENYIGVSSIDYVHSNFGFFNDVEVEVHFRPSWMYNPFFNRKLQAYFRKYETEQFKRFDKELGISYPTIRFNLVYSMVHINRHIFEEGIGLRQLLDYYYILKNSTLEERKEAYSVLSEIGLCKFTAAM